MNAVTRDEWDAFLENHPEAHILQTSAWGLLKSGYGWQPNWIVSGNAGAQVLLRRLPLGFWIGYVPKGPVGSHWRGTLTEIEALCKRKKMIFLKIEPDLWETDPDGQLRQMNGFHSGARTIQPQRTIVIDLNGSEEEILGRMKQKTRYNIRLAEKKDIVVERNADINNFNSLMAVTAERDNFGVHAGRYYQDAFKFFEKKGSVNLFMAFYQGTPLAAIMVFQRGLRAWYFYGASNNLERNRMPTYLVQWRAIQWAKSQGCSSYDLWGVPDEEEQVLENEFEHRSEGLWGVYRFKRGFGGEVRRSAGAWDKVYHPCLYRFVQWWQARRGEAA
jgi:peptidoglycan pentaglycine glycine transferase (the first glycine)